MKVLWTQGPASDMPQDKIVMKQTSDALQGSLQKIKHKRDPIQTIPLYNNKNNNNNVTKNHSYCCP